MTGAGRGIGRAVAGSLARAGAAVVVNDTGGAVDGSHPDRAVAERAATELRRAGAVATAHHESVATMAGGQSLVDAALAEHGRLDVLVNCAGNSIQALPWDMDETAWDAVVATHLKGHFSCMRAAAAPMRAQGSGCMVAVSSRAGLSGVADAPAYSAAKAGIIGLMRSFALALEPSGVTVNAIVPSAATRLSPRTLAGPDGVAEFVTYLATPDARSVTGSVFALSGGHVGLYGPSEEVASLDRPGAGWDLEALLGALPGSGLTARTLRPGPAPVPPPS